MKCDIIIVTYNALPIVKRCIASVKKHTKFPYRLIIVDNHSSHNMADYLSTVKNAKIILNKKNYGFGYANNQALDVSDSEYVCFLNSDTIVTDGWLTKLIDVLESNEAGMVGPVTNYVSSTCQEAEVDFQYRPESNDDSKVHEFAKERYDTYKEEVIETNRLVGFCLVTKQKVIKQSGQFDERYMIGNFEDDDLGLRILERGYKLYCANGVFIYHFGGESFKDEYKKKTQQEILETNRKKYVEKWYDSGRINHLKTVTKPLRIVYLLASDSATGGVKVVFEHCNRLAARGHDVKIICGIKEAARKWFDIKVPIIYNNLETIPACDILVGTYFTTLPYLQKSHARVKVHLCQGYEGLLHEDRAVLGTISTNYASIPDKIVISKWLKEIIDDKYKINSNYISNGIDPYVFSFKRHKRNKVPRILITGTFSLGIKGVDVAIKAIQKLQHKFEIVRLSSSDAQGEPIKSEYYNMSRMTQDEIARVYESCDITICASYKVEGFSLHPLESMASGTPVITTDNGGVMDYAKSNYNAVVVPAGKPEAIAHNINLLLNNVDLYEKLAENGINTAKGYYWYKKIDEIEKLYYGLFKKAIHNGTTNISLCMIVKDEEENLERCLNSAQGLVSEIVLVDTGSTDDTIIIGRKYGATIYHYKWEDDFSAARNFALSKATQPWILVLDADESISIKDYDKLKKAVKQNKCAYTFDTRNYVQSANYEGAVANDKEYEEAADYYGWCISSKVRLFPNDKNVRFRGKVHELVERSLSKAGVPVHEIDVPIHHYGHTKRNVEKERKYAKLGKEKLKKNKNDLKSIVELANQYMGLNNYDEALVLWRRALALKPNHPEFLSKIGTTYNLIQDYERSEEFFKKSLEIEQTEYTLKHLGIAYAKRNMFQEAYNAFSKVAYGTRDMKAKGDFAYCCNMLRKFDEAIQILEGCLKIDQKKTIEWGLLEIAYNEKGIELAKKGRFRQAMALFHCALKVNPSFKNAQLNIAELNRITQQTQVV